MASVILVHWNEAEARALAAPLIQFGFRVALHWSSEAQADFRTELPDALVISLELLPSHGRAIAEWFWEAKKRQGIPLLFCGGKADKVDALRTRFPRAVFCPRDQLILELQRISPSPG